MTPVELALGPGISLVSLVISLYGVRVAKRTASAAIEHDEATRQKERNAAAAKRFVSIYTLPDRVTGHNEARRLAGELFAELGGDKPGRYAATVAYMFFCGGGQGSEPEQRRGRSVTASRGACVRASRGRAPSSPPTTTPTTSVITRASQAGRRLSG